MQTDTFRDNLKISLMALAVAVGLILILLAFRPQLTQTTPGLSMSVIDAVQPASVAKPVEVPVGSHLDADGIARVNPPANWQAKPDCKTQGLRTWTHEDASGSITFYCKK